MIFLWSGDSASLDRVGDWTVGDLHILFFSSMPFSASELEKRQRRFTLDIQRRQRCRGGAAAAVATVAGEDPPWSLVRLANVEGDSCACSQ